MPAKNKTNASDEGTTKAPVRFSREVTALRKSKALNRTSGLLLPAVRIQNNMRKVIQRHKARYGLEKVFLSALAVHRMVQLAESHISQVIQDSLLFTVAGGRIRLKNEDLLGACKISDGAHGKVLSDVFDTTYYEQSKDLQAKMEKVKEQHAKAAARKRENKKHAAPQEKKKKSESKK